MTTVVAPLAGEPALLPRNDVFILGAGFSRAICPDAMPTLDALGGRLAALYRQRPSFSMLPASAANALNAGRMPTGSLEGWLSHLATPAPFLDEAERFFNRGIAAELMQLVADEIATSEAEARAKPMPPWLARLIRLWDRTSATLITFNYDTLLERAVPAAKMPWVTDPTSAPLLNTISPVQILKLHGSIHWWKLPTDQIGTSLDIEPLDGGWEGPPQSSIAGMVPLIVPPLAIKSEYFDLSIVREAWMRARRMLSQARRVVIMGYSVPATDLTVGALLSQYLAVGARVHVVDLAAESVTQRLAAMGLSANVAHTGADAIAAFVDEYESELSHEATSALLSLFDGFRDYPDAPVMANLADRPRPWPISQIIREPKQTVLLAGPEEAKPRLNRAELQATIREAAVRGDAVVLRVDGEADRPVWHVAYRHLTYANFYTLET